MRDVKEFYLLENLFILFVSLLAIPCHENVLNLLLFSSYEVKKIMKMLLDYFSVRPC